MLFARKGYVAVTISYRLAPDAKFPAQIEDCKAAVRWLRANAKKYRIDPDHIGVVGFSAGGHLCCLLGVTDKKDGLEGEGGNADQSSRVQAVVSYFGPTDLCEKTWSKDVEEKVLAPFVGASFDDKPALYKKVSPITYVPKDAPPLPVLPRLEGHAGGAAAFEGDVRKTPGRRRQGQVRHPGRRGPRLGRRETQGIGRADDCFLRRVLEKEMNTIQERAARPGNPLAASRSRRVSEPPGPYRSGEECLDDEGGVLSAGVAKAARVDGWRAMRFVLVVAVALYLVFCHGCHRDQDNEALHQGGSQRSWASFLNRPGRHRPPGRFEKPAHKKPSPGRFEKPARQEPLLRGRLLPEVASPAA